MSIFMMIKASHDEPIRCPCSANWRTLGAKLGRSQSRQSGDVRHECRVDLDTAACCPCHLRTCGIIIHSKRIINHMKSRSASSDIAAIAARNWFASWSATPRRARPAGASRGCRRTARHPPCQDRPRICPATREAVRAEGLALVFLATPAGSFHGTGAGHAGRRRARRRPERRLPPAHAGKLHRLVQGAAHPAGTAGRGRLRAAGVLPRAHSRARAWSPIPGCYPTAANLAIRPLVEAGRGGPRRRHRLRRQIGRQRRGPQAQPQDQLLRGHRELLGLFHPASTGTCPKCC